MGIAERMGKRPYLGGATNQGNARVSARSDHMATVARATVDAPAATVDDVSRLSARVAALEATVAGLVARNALPSVTEALPLGVTALPKALPGVTTPLTPAEKQRRYRMRRKGKPSP